MAVIGGPKKIPLNGLKYFMDPANKRSYPGSGTTVTDLGEFGFDGTFTGDTTFSSDNAGTFTFDGNGDGIDLGNRNFAISSGATTEFTLIAWIYNTNTNSNAAYVDIGFTGGQMLLYTSSGHAKKIRFYVYNQSGTGIFNNLSNTVLDNNTWYQIGARWKASNNTCEGIFDGSVTGVTFSTSGMSSLNSSAAEQVTFASNWNDLNGRMGPVKYYNRYLSADELTSNWNSTRGRFGK